VCAKKKKMTAHEKKKAAKKEAKEAKKRAAAAAVSGGDITGAAGAGLRCVAEENLATPPSSLSVPASSTFPACPRVQCHVLDIDADKWYSGVGMLVEQTVERYFREAGAGALGETRKGEEELVKGGTAGGAGAGTGAGATGAAAGDGGEGGSTGGVTGSSSSAFTVPSAFAEVHWHMCDITHPYQRNYAVERPRDGAAIFEGLRPGHEIVPADVKGSAPEGRGEHGNGLLLNTAVDQQTSESAIAASTASTDLRSSPPAVDASGVGAASGVDASGVALVVCSYLFTPHFGLPGDQSRFSAHVERGFWTELLAANPTAW
jgi:hypothetical protein